MNAETKQRLWAVNILGPDDIFAVESREAAIVNANKFNAWWEETFRHHRAADANEHSPVCWAVPIEWSGAAEHHARNLADPDGEYRDFRSPAKTTGSAK